MYWGRGGTRGGQTGVCIFFFLSFVVGLFLGGFGEGGGNRSML